MDAWTHGRIEDAGIVLLFGTGAGAATTEPIRNRAISFIQIVRFH